MMSQGRLGIDRRLDGYEHGVAQNDELNDTRYMSGQT